MLPLLTIRMRIVQARKSRTMDFIRCMGRTYLLDLSGGSMSFMKSCRLLLSLLIKRL
ncbi:hypothetical protein OESDEN_24650 [Oesophagostomum dentatum]|uniref:Uncharacterized protein n=1 Tax=Oesophagostomum dentatum TaxID=61180 RepID=A0A0B1RST7_OESDE|nr:hypothetical protein OESDEN_24650 [Oesophagostomum dentatum]